MSNAEWNSIWFAIIVLAVGHGLIIGWVAFRLFQAWEKIWKLIYDMVFIYDKTPYVAYAHGEKEEKRMATVQVFKDEANEWRWRVVAANGNILADSGEGYKNKEDCKAGAKAAGEALVSLDA
jgi:uncharacterized protein YegP (UPF0339 family)